MAIHACLWIAAPGTGLAMTAQLRLRPPLSGFSFQVSGRVRGLSAVAIPRHESREDEDHDTEHQQEVGGVG